MKKNPSFYASVAGRQVPGHIAKLKKSKKIPVITTAIQECHSIFSQILFVQN